jgi:hypothetical protein
LRLWVRLRVGLRLRTGLWVGLRTGLRALGREGVSGGAVGTILASRDVLEPALGAIIRERIAGVGVVADLEAVFITSCRNLLEVISPVVGGAVDSPGIAGTVLC